ncbi:MAG TPA: 2-C-methyl-D-erythritol 4-phosphate cytidylyltransferase [Gammaproteobacteria bacterium]|nr:2-C-methyl-D-erythritol 4-phosphate cytidylyltransferase [Gammaproteobacteria bacterium]
MNRRWVIVPAAGVGRRMGSERPKQYLELAGMPVLSHVLQRFAGLSQLAAIVVALNPEDHYWNSIAKPSHARLQTVAGGAERRHSVWNALGALDGEAHDRDWVLVHDAARPCVRIADVLRLLGDIERHPAGGLLALPLTDTVKRGDSAMQAEATVDRSGLWRAQTPQVFRYGALKAALGQALAGNRAVTDESQAMELAGHRPLLVAGSADNIKITDMQDMKLAELYLQLQAAERKPERERA